MVLAESKCKLNNGSILPIEKRNADIPIDSLLLGELTTKSLKDAGYTTLKSLAFSPINQIINDTHLGRQSIKSAVNMAFQNCISFSPASEVWNERKQSHYLTTCSNRLDEILGFGVEFGTITEVFGKSGCGKTQLCHQLCVNVQLSQEKGGVGGNSLYLDLKGDFRPERILEMGISLKIKNPLNYVFYERVYSTDYLHATIKKMPSLLTQKNVRLIVIDSLISPFLNEFHDYDAEQDALERIMGDLKQLCALYPYISIVITNEVSEKTKILYGDPIYALGSHAIAHNVTTRIYLKESRQQERIAHLIHSPWRPTCDTSIFITEDGIRDYPTKKELSMEEKNNEDFNDLYS
jgi:DNA repair protein RadA